MCRFFAWLIVFIAICSALSCRQQAPASTSNALRERARVLVNEGNVLCAEAVDWRRGATAKGPNQRAILKYSEAIRLCPDLVEAYIGRCLAHDALGNRNQALVDARTALALKPTKPIDYSMIALVFSGAERRRILKAGMDRSAPGKLAYDTLWSQFARAYMDEGDYESYVSEQRKLIAARLKSKDPHIISSLSTNYQLLGTGYVALKRYAEAERSFRDALKHEARVRQQIVIDLRQFTKYEQLELQKLLEDQDRAVCYLCEQIIRSRMKQGDVRATRAALREFQPQLRKNSVDKVYAALLDVLEGNRRKPDVQLVSQARRLAKDDFLHRFSVGMLLIRHGSRREAAKELSEFVQKCGPKPGEMTWEVKTARAWMVKLAKN